MIQEKTVAIMSRAVSVGLYSYTKLGKTKASETHTNNPKSLSILYWNTTDVHNHYIVYWEKELEADSIRHRQSNFHGQYCRNWDNVQSCIHHPSFSASRYPICYGHATNFHTRYIVKRHFHDEDCAKQLLSF